MRPDPPSAVTLASAQAGERQALCELLDGWAPVVLAWCKRLGGPRVDPHDAAQEALLVLWDRVERVHSPEVFRSWLFGVTRRIVARHRRTSWIKRWVGELAREPVDTDPSPLGFAELSETARRVQDTLEALPAPMREVLVLCVVEEWTDEEAAELLGIPTGTVKSRLRRARQRFSSAARRRGLDATPAVEPVDWKTA